MISLMKTINLNHCLFSFIVLVFTTSCQYSRTQSEKIPKKEIIVDDLKGYDSIPKIKVMILGTYHFAQEKTDELSPNNKAEIDTILDRLAKFKPTKVLIEKETEQSKVFLKAYHDYLSEDFDISNRPNEIFQLGFRLAEKLKHDSIFLFDNQPPFIGSLKDFSFKNFDNYAKTNDKGFYDKHIKEIMRHWSYNDSLLKTLPLLKRITIINSPKMQTINANRMHMYEIRVGIGDSYIGADWLGRWYQRNIRMTANLLKMANSGDRLICIVGDNHKWILEQLIINTPDFSLISSYDYLKNE